MCILHIISNLHVSVGFVPQSLFLNSCLFIFEILYDVSSWKLSSDVLFESIVKHIIFFCMCKTSISIFS